ncbi:MAG: cyclopropane fatty acyl phospholipid synthase [Candidatus Marinimicrobia bacterium]|nr:cyclopropane fatty acyl phospholipid synthase [Candidatus Neomarinimicrobiota bacterium]
MRQNKAESTLRSLLSLAGVEVNGNQPHDIRIYDNRFYRRVLADGALGFGESYMDGWWDCEALDQFFYEVLRVNLDNEVKGNWKTQLQVLKYKIFNLQKTSRAYEVGEKHYDIGNDLYLAMLDKRLNYTCGYWKDAQNLDQAQEAKLELVCKKLNLAAGMKILELGCGFGSFAKYAAEKFNVEVTGLTVSKAQVELGTELCKGLPVKLKLEDYRNVSGSFDRVISIGIMEHVGYKNYRTYMKVVDRTLKKDGLAFIHTIGDNVSGTHANAWTEKYIFPNGMVPSIAQLGKAMERLFIMEDWHNFGPDYDKTLMAWYENFENSWPDLKDKYGERFYRMWKYYLLNCAGSFRARAVQLWQIVLNRLGREQPDCRIN